MRVQSAQALSAKIFIEFIALIVRNRIYNLLKEMMLRLETRPNYMTVPAALRGLEKIEMVRRNNGQKSELGNPSRPCLGKKLELRTWHRCMFEMTICKNR